MPSLLFSLVVNFNIMPDDPYNIIIF